MKGPTRTTTVQDFYQDVSDFLEKTLSSEVLSRQALEHRARLLEKLPFIIKAAHNTTMELYIDMSTTANTVDSFFSLASVNNETYEEPLDSTKQMDSFLEAPDSHRCSTPLESQDESSGDAESGKTSSAQTPASSVVYEDAISVTSDSSVVTNSDLVSMSNVNFISATEAETHKIHSGQLKRRNSRKLLTAWRQCWAILVPNQLLLYSNKNDKKPKTVIELVADGFEVKLGLRQKTDVKRLKMQTFSIILDKKPIYEFAAKTREELDNWLEAFRTVSAKKEQSPPPEDFYDEPFDGEIYDVIHDVIKTNDDVYDEVVPPQNSPKIADKDCNLEEIYESLNLQEKTSSADVSQETYDTLPSLIRPVDTPVNQTPDLRLVQHIDIEGPEVYDIPQSNKPITRRLSDDLGSYDIVMTPPKSAVHEKTPNNIKKLTQFWQGQMISNPVAAVTKSVGRSFSKPSSSRPNIEKIMTNSLVFETIEKLTINQKPELSSPGKKEPPPRPPGPYRVSPMEPISRLEKNSEVSKSQFKARWAYVAQNTEEVSMNHGEVVDVISKSGSFWLVQSRHKTGLVPREYLVQLSTS